MGFEINFYKTVENKCPVEIFLDSLDAKSAQKTTWVLNLVEDLKVIPKKYFKKLAATNEIWEIRVKTNIGYIRIFGFIEKKSFILTNGIIKKTDKTPKKEINKAEYCKQEYYLRRKYYE